MPSQLSVKVGAKVTFTNNDTAAHTASASDNTAFDTGGIAKGKQATVTLKKAGSYPYICQFHPFMKGTIVVK
jgi:plastocyanin